MGTIDDLIAISIRKESVEPIEALKSGMPHYTIVLWHGSSSNAPLEIEVPYRGGVQSGFNDLLTYSEYLFIADAEGVIAYDLTRLATEYAALKWVGEISQRIISTSDSLITSWDRLVQGRSLIDLVNGLDASKFEGEEIVVPYRELDIEDGPENILLNNSGDRSHLISSLATNSKRVEFTSKQEFPYTFQRREQFHILPYQPSQYSIFTESTSDDRHPNRVYSLDIRGPPTITEHEPLHLKDRQILSMIPTPENQLTILTNREGSSYVETLEPHRREILASRPLGGTYELGDRLQQIENDLLIVRHLHNEIVDVATEASIHLTGAENDIPIPEISSMWNVPQYLYVTKIPTGVR